MKTLLRLLPFLTLALVSLPAAEDKTIAAVRAADDERLAATKSGDPTRLDYVMRNTQAGWRAIDILLNGTISRVAVQRSDFRGLLAAGDPAPLLASLRDRAERLAAGSKP